VRRRKLLHNDPSGELTRSMKKSEHTWRCAYAGRMKEAAHWQKSFLKAGQPIPYTGMETVGCLLAACLGR